MIIEGFRVCLRRGSRGWSSFRRPSTDTLIDGVTRWSRGVTRRSHGGHSVLVPVLPREPCFIGSRGGHAESRGGHAVKGSRDGHAVLVPPLTADSV